MKKYFLMILVLFFLISCNNSNELLKEVRWYEDLSIAGFLNGLAGKNGSVTYFNPNRQTANANYKYFGASVNRDGLEAKYIFLIDLVSKEYKDVEIIFNGITVEDALTDMEYMDWLLSSDL